jgi:hypothetical protein
MTGLHDGPLRAVHTRTNSETLKPDAADWLAHTSGGVNCETGWVAGSDLAVFVWRLGKEGGSVVMSTSGSAARTATVSVSDRAVCDPAAHMGQTLSLRAVVAALQRALAHRRGAASGPGGAYFRLGQAVTFGSADVDECKVPVQLGWNPAAGGEPRHERETLWLQGARADYAGGLPLRNRSRTRPRRT